MLGVTIYLFFAAAIGVFLGMLAQSLPQFGPLFMLAFLPMNRLSGSDTPLDSMPPGFATATQATQASPSTHFVSFAQSILYRGAGFDTLWPKFLAVAAIGGLFFMLAIWLASQAT